MNLEIQNWAFIAPQLSRHLSEYFEGILDFVKDNPSIFLHSFTFADRNIAALPNMDGIISYAVPPPEVMEVFRASGKPHPPLVAITMCKPKDRTITYAHIDPDGVAERVFGVLSQRRCRSYAFCASHAPYLAGESAALLNARSSTKPTRCRGSSGQTRRSTST